ncbi:Eukaryotic translation initiation factor 3 subunit F [Hibiscus syriacus]|uniref:Eukaryotic translation initiation factor 3 subunit F n=1 Tax=Hibiscus syriacus TaxID=106335 RepID=A0A6A2YA82_HIBSY|nr:Eukaryotic translation initiation factor 3 subunit F [Hibiscus syriacus]
MATGDRVRDQAERGIGTLLDSVLSDDTVDIRNSYAVPHTESAEQVALDIEYHHNMLVFHQKVNPKDVIVGWYSTGLGVTGGSVLINDFYSREVLNPVHLTVDTGFRNGEGTIKAYVSVNLALGDRQLAAQFLLIYAWFSDLDLFLALIDDIYRYVDDVVEGCVASDNSIGRFISDTVAALP